MSETQPKPRPWHGHANPMDAFHDWVVSEFNRLREEMRTPAPTPNPAPTPHVETPKPAETIAAPVASANPATNTITTAAPKPADA